jgi:hypothetical protein
LQDGDRMMNNERVIPTDVLRKGVILPSNTIEERQPVHSCEKNDLQHVDFSKRKIEEKNQYLLDYKIEFPKDLSYQGKNKYC